MRRFQNGPIWTLLNETTGWLTHKPYAFSYVLDDRMFELFWVIWDLFDDLNGLVSCSSDRANAETYGKKKKKKNK